MVIVVATVLAVVVPTAAIFHFSPRSFIPILIALHSLYFLREVFTKPQNIFTALGVPTNYPTDALRALLLNQASDGELPSHMEMLLRRLGSFDMRTLYVRFGHDALATCEYCMTSEDYALFSFPRPLLAYIREVALIGLLTLPSTPRVGLRAPALGALIIAALSESYWTLSSPISLGDGASSWMLHDTIVQYRNILFLLLPLLVQFLPLGVIPAMFRPQIQPPPFAPLHETLSHLLPTLHLLKYTNAVLMRSPTLRARASSWWDGEAREGTWIREDEGVVKQATATGFGFWGEDENGVNKQGDGPLRTSARMALRTLLDAVRPSEHWK